MIAEGDYMGCLAEATTTYAQTGNPQMEIRVWIDETTARTVYLPLTDAARSSWVDATLEFLGFNGKFDEPAFGEKFYEMGGLPLRCVHDTYNGKLKEKWDVNRGGKQNEPAPRDVVARLNADWKSKRGGGPKPAGAPPTRSPAPAARPASSSAPPARSGPPPAKSEPEAKPFGKDEAWEAWEAEYARDGKPVDTELWHKRVAEFGKEETFGEVQWRKVAELAGVPF